MIIDGLHCTGASPVFWGESTNRIAIMTTINNSYSITAGFRYDIFSGAMHRNRPCGALKNMS